jgi:hypothetical protein
MILCSFLGLPPSHGLIPQAPLHVMDLKKKEKILPNIESKEQEMEIEVESINVENEGVNVNPKESTTHFIVENRCSNLIQPNLIL